MWQVGPNYTRSSCGRFRGIADIGRRPAGRPATGASVYNPKRPLAAIQRMIFGELGAKIVMLEGAGFKPVLSRHRPVARDVRIIRPAYRIIRNVIANAIERFL